MKKNTILLFVTFVFFIIICLSGCTNTTTESAIQSTEKETESVTEEQRQTDFRDVCWGDDIETVKKLEDAQFIDEDENCLLYSANVAGHTMNLSYLFENGKLYEAGYMDNCGHTTSGQFVGAYDSLKESLTKLYGTPKTDEIVNTVDQDLIDAAGSSALDYGYIVYRATWVSENTNILLGCMSENYKTQLIIQYKDANYEENLEDSGL